MTGRPAPGECWVHDPLIGWRKMSGFKRWYCADRAEDVPSLLDELEAGNGISVGYVGYEAGVGFDAAQSVHAGQGPYAEFAQFERAAVAELPSGETSFVSTWHARTNQREYERCIDAHLRAIARGDFYQVNQTLRLIREGKLDPWCTFLSMVRAQGAAYGAYLDFVERVVISVSPELFFRRERGKITCEPMKGTRRRGRWPAEDESQKRELMNSDKDRAENLMITDMVRNDLGRIAEPGSVQVTELFKVRPYPAMWQMVSKIEAASNATLSQVFAATFPAASITGAPKIKAMQQICQFEPEPRGVYCGAVGTIEPGGRALFNVAIRTAVYKPGAERTIYGVGSGIVADSNSREEWAECWVKAEVVTREWPEFDLFETLRCSGGSPVAIEKHHNRMSFSAGVFGFKIPDVEEFRRTATNALTGFNGDARLKFTLRRNGDLSAEATPFEPWPTELTLALSDDKVDPAEWWPYHKTTERGFYERAKAQLTTANDALLANIHGNITETTRANVAVSLDGRWCTPPLQDGLLPGICRATLLEAGAMEERSIHVSDLRRARGLIVLNSLRGWAQANLIGFEFPKDRDELPIKLSG